MVFLSAPLVLLFSISWRRMSSASGALSAAITMCRSPRALRPVK